MTQINKTMAKDFIPLVKMVKAWNREVGKPIKGFHLECMMYDRYRTYTQTYTYDSMLRFFFEALPGYLKAASYDPVTGDRVDGYLGSDVPGSDRRTATTNAETAARLAREAYDDESKYHESIAINEWKALLGEFFPSHG